MSRWRSHPDRGISLIETMIASAIFLATAMVLFQFAARGQRLARSQPDATDQHQRLRVAAGMLRRDLLNAGAGMFHGVTGGPLVDYLAPIVPARTGARTPDPENSWFPDRISILYVPAGGWHARLVVDMTDPAADVPLDAGSPGCPTAGLCGFAPGSRAILIDSSGLGAGYSLFSVTGTTGGLAHGSPNPPFGRAYPSASSVVMPIVHRIYYLDRSSRRLMFYDGYQTDVPLVDGVVDLRFGYFADPMPDSVREPADGDENCVYRAGDPPVPLLEYLGGRSPAALPPARMIDGPICGVSPHRFDGDLLRIRRVVVTIRLEVSADYLRGSGASFAREGNSPDGDSYVRDYEITFDVSPRNMVPRR
ncbi:MAG TPA: hypothetical protein VLD67_12180 [Vicinamibacterales bacterium]|nr:hypothetical protein [Vicinamibacterales bacterium]